MLTSSPAVPLVLPICSQAYPLPDGRMPLDSRWPAPLQGPTNRREQLISYTGPLLLDHATGRVAPVAPTMRLRGGDTFAIDFYNNLTYPKGTKFDPHHGLNGFHDPFAT